MGMYTEVSIGVQFKENLDEEFIRILNYMAGNLEDETDFKPKMEHPLFATDRWWWMLQSGGSFYFDRIPFRRFSFNDISQCWYLTVATNIKNYTGEWRHFLNFIAPYVCTSGFIGTYQHEEDEDPTLLYAEDGKIIFKVIDFVVEYEHVD